MSKPRSSKVWKKSSGFILNFNYEQSSLYQSCWDLSLQDFWSKWGYCRINGQECVHSRILQDYWTNLTPEQIVNQHKIHSYSSENVTKSGRISTQNTWSFSLRIHFFSHWNEWNQPFCPCLGRGRGFLETHLRKPPPPSPQPRPPGPSSWQSWAEVCHTFSRSISKRCQG